MRLRTKRKDTEKKPKTPPNYANLGSWFESRKVQKNYKDFLEEMNGSLACDCDHGCRQWIVTQQYKTALLLMITQTKGITSLDKVVRMHPDRATRIWFRIQDWKTRRFNRLLREGKLDGEGNEILEKI